MIDISGLQASLNNLATTIESILPTIRTVAEIPIAAMGIGRDMQAFQFAMQKVTGQIPVIGSMVDYTESTRKTLDDLSKLGIGANDLTEMFARLNAIGLSEEKYRKFVLDAQTSVSGATAEDRARKAEQLLLMTRETAIGKQLLEQSTSNIEVLAQTVLLEAGRNGVLLESTEQMQAVAERAAATAANLDSLARITGQSRDEISAEIRERKTSVKNRMFENLLSEEQRIQYTKSITSLQELGPGIQDLAQTLAMNGRLSDTQKLQLAVLGDDGARLGQLMRASVNPNLDETQRRNLELEIENLKVRISRTQSTPEYFQMMTQAKGPIGDVSETLASENKIRDLIAAELELERKTRPEVSAEEVYQKIQQRSKLEQVGRIGTGAAIGTIDVGQALSIEINRFMLDFQTRTAGLASAVDQMAKDALSATNAVDELSRALRTVREDILGGDFSSAPSEIATSLGIGGTGPQVTPPGPAGSPRPFVPLTSGPAGGTLPGYNLGTFGVHGEWFRDFGASGTVAKLHGKEAVVPFDQLDEFVEFARHELKDTQQKHAEFRTPLFDNQFANKDDLGFDIKGEIQQLFNALAKVTDKIIGTEFEPRPTPAIISVHDYRHPYQEKSSLQEITPRPKSTQVDASELTPRPKLSQVDASELTPRPKSTQVDASELFPAPRPKSTQVDASELTPRPKSTQVDASELTPRPKSTQVDASELFPAPRPKLSQVDASELTPRPKSTQVDASELFPAPRPKLSQVDASELTPRSKSTQVNASELTPRPKLSQVDLDKKHTSVTPSSKHKTLIDTTMPLDRSPLEQRFDSIVKEIQREESSTEKWKPVSAKQKTSPIDQFFSTINGTEPVHKNIHTRLSEITPPEAMRIPSATDIASKMQTGITPFAEKSPVDSESPTKNSFVASVDSSAAVIKSIEQLSHTMVRSLGAPLSDIRRSSRNTEKSTKKMRSVV